MAAKPVHGSPNPVTPTLYAGQMLNTLYYGDNLDVLRRHIEDHSVDLVYLDPPFNSNATYNVLFSEQDGTQAAAQVVAFDDTWRWDTAAVLAYEDVVSGGGSPHLHYERCGRSLAVPTCSPTCR